MAMLELLYSWGRQKPRSHHHQSLTTPTTRGSRCCSHVGIT